MKRLLIILVIAGVILMVSCNPVENLPDEPSVEFRAFTLFDSIDILGNPAKAGKLNFYFEDGDGDLGNIAPELPGQNASSNLFLKLYRKRGNDFELVVPGDPLYPSEYRIPFLLPEGQNRILRGTIDVTLFYFLYEGSDTLYYDFWIRDRAGNESNTASTCLFVLDENGTCTID